MSKKVNCWEFKKCGREENGDKVPGQGVCPTAADNSGSGINDGVKGGRICWAVSGTFCGGKIQGTFAQKQENCLECDFFEKVKHEEGTRDFSLVKGV